MAPTFTQRLSNRLSMLSPLAQRGVVAGVSGVGGGLLGGLLGGRRGGRVGATLGAVGGGIFGPSIVSFFRPRPTVAQRVDISLGLVPAITQATTSSDTATGRTLSTARRIFGTGDRARAGRILQTEQTRLRLAQIQPFNLGLVRRTRTVAGTFGVRQRVDLSSLILAPATPRMPLNLLNPLGLVSRPGRIGG